MKTLAAMVVHRFYIDEAGHAGANYLDESQPFHIAGGYLVPDDKREAFSAVLERVTKGQGEVKGARLTRTPGGQRKATAYIRLFGEAGAVPFFWAMEREYCIAGKIVSVFLDPAYYQECAWLPLWDLNRREEITERLVDVLSPELLRRFGEAYRAPSEASWDAFLRDLQAELASTGDGRLASTFGAARSAINKIVSCEDMRDEHANMAALNMPALMHCLRMVDRFIDYRGGSFTIVHDANVQFEKHFTQMVSRWQVAANRPAELRMPDGYMHREFLRNVDSICFRDSKEVRELQAADILVSSLARLTKKIPTPPNRWPTEMRELATVTLPPILHEVSLLGGMYAHMDTKTRLLIAMMDLAKGDVSA